MTRRLPGFRRRGSPRSASFNDPDANLTIGCLSLIGSTLTVEVDFDLVRPAAAFTYAGRSRRRPYKSRSRTAPPDRRRRRPGTSAMEPHPRCGPGTRSRPGAFPVTLVVSNLPTFGSGPLRSPCRRPLP
jgi:hypothetical protein